MAAQKSRRLQHVDHRCHPGNLVFGVNVGEHWQAQFALDLGQNLQPLVNAGATKGAAAGAVGLVKAAFENERDAQALRDVLQGAGSVHLQLLGFDHARPGNQKKGLMQANLKTTQLHQATALDALVVLCWSSAARMNALNSGCPSQGVDLNSG